MKPPVTPTQQAIACLEKAIEHIRTNDATDDPNEIRAALIEVGGAKTWVRHMIHPYPVDAR